MQYSLSSGGSVSSGTLLSVASSICETDLDRAFFAKREDFFGADDAAAAAAFLARAAAELPGFGPGFPRGLAGAALIGA